MPYASVRDNDAPQRRKRIVAKFQVAVSSLSPEKHVELMKALRSLADLELKDAKTLAEFLASALPCTLVAGVDRPVAEHAASVLQEAGAVSVVEESSATAPLFLSPSVNELSRWDRLRGRVAVE
jgi:ribosomal protein L7/L12